MRSKFWLKYIGQRGKPYGSALAPWQPVTVAGERAGVQVVPKTSGERDAFDVYLTHGSQAGGPPVLIGTVRHTHEGPQWSDAHETVTASDANAG